MELSIVFLGIAVTISLSIWGLIIRGRELEQLEKSLAQLSTSVRKLIADDRVPLEVAEFLVFLHRHAASPAFARHLVLALFGVGVSSSNGSIRQSKVNELVQLIIDLPQKQQQEVVHAFVCFGAAVMSSSFIFSRLLRFRIVAVMKEQAAGKKMTINSSSRVVDIVHATARTKDFQTECFA